ncbi:MAG: DNA polymerase I [Acidimicrobiales bacterium]
MATYLLLDGNSLAYRAFFALPSDLATASGQVTNAVFGFTSMLINLLRDHKPDGVIVAFDRPEPTFRHEVAGEYKANRNETPDILRQQMGLVRQVLEVLGITAIELVGYEADDIIATLATQLRDQGDEAIIVTGDRDAYQLVEDPYIKVLYNKRGVSEYALYDEAGILERTGVTPAQYPEYAALRGDPSDNLDGVPGVGEKTAAKLITMYGGLDGVFAAVAAQTPKLRENLAAHEVRVRRNAKIMILLRDAPIVVDLTQVTVNPSDPTEVKRLFDFLEFRSLHERLSEVLGASAGGPPPPDRQVLEAELIRPANAAEAAAILARPATLDIAPRWTGEPGRSPLAGIAVVVEPATADVLWISAEVLADPAILGLLTDGRPLRAHDAKPLLRSLLALGVDIDALAFDTAIAAYLLDPGQARYDLEEVLGRWTGASLAVGAAAEGQLDFAGEATDDITQAARAALAVNHLIDPLGSALEVQGMRGLYDDIENPLVRVLARMEDVGVGVDVVALRALHDRLTAECARLTTAIYEAAGHEFNINSTPQLRQVLFDEMALSPQKKTKTGFSTDAASLERLRDQHVIIDLLLDYREVEKLRSTYGEGLLAEVAGDGRIHATFNQTVARTGRLSSDKPNLHNIPVRSDEGRQFREAFVSAPGHELIVADYNQIELRCIAHLAQDPGLIAAFTSQTDIHTATASRLFGVEAKAVTLEQRSKAKMVSYGLAYGMEAYGLGQRLNISTEEAAEILKAYFVAFPAVKAYMDRTVTEARRRGFTETLFGRRRPIPELSSDNYRIRQAGERQAMNAGIQGLAADIFKVALIRLDRALEDQGLTGRLVLQVHDEVLVETPAGELDTVTELTRTTLAGAATLSVPLEVNLSVGRSWAAAKS